MLSLRELVEEFYKGCTCGKPGECQECKDGFIKAVEFLYNPPVPVPISIDIENTFSPESIAQAIQAPPMSISGKTVNPPDVKFLPGAPGPPPDAHMTYNPGEFEIIGSLAVHFEDPELYKQFTQGGPQQGESDRQLILRALAIQSLCYPGFEYANREIAKKLKGEAMFDEFKILLADMFDAFELWTLNIDQELNDDTPV